MKRSTLVLASLLLGSSTAHAVVADHPDDICPPASDPCIVDDTYSVTAALDFGARKVHIVTGGKLQGQPGLSIEAGALEISTGLTSSPPIEAGSGGGVGITIWKACSGDGTTRCLIDDQCSSLGLGTCTAGNTGTIDADGTMSAAGADPGGITIRAAGDITLERRLNANATVSGISPGDIRIQSYQGTVSAAQLTSSSDLGTFDYETGYGGFIDVTSAEDVVLSNALRAWGQGEGGQVSISAGRDVLVHSDIIADTGAAQYANGGFIDVEAGQNLTLSSLAGGDSTQEIGTDGGGVFNNAYGYGYWQSGYGGESVLIAGADVNLGPGSVVHSQGGPGAKAGSIHVYSFVGDVNLEGTIRAQGLWPPLSGDAGAGGGYVYVTADDDLTMSQGALIDLSSPLGFGGVMLDAGGDIDLDGEIDVRGTATGYYVYGTGGAIRIGSDEVSDTVRIRGTLRSGGQGASGYGYGMQINACRLRLDSGSLIKTSVETTNESGPPVDIRIGESMIAEAGSRILTDPASGTLTTIRYRDGKKPPVLGGTVTPAPLLVTAPAIPGCPVCGNGEIDQGESCDDGNLTSGDGCRSDCQDEGCIADTPGYPSTSLCDDGIACSQDDCDPVAHACVNTPSCDDGVACTVDTCDAEGCHHAASDTLCNDDDECTFDLCNSSTGCVYADLTGNECEDGDYCTAAGSCQQGSCSVTPALVATAGSIKTKVPAGAANDLLKAVAELSAEGLDVDATASGARLVVADADDQVIFQMDLPADAWTKKSSGVRTKSQFSSARGAAASPDNVSTVALLRDSGKDSARVKVKLRGAELAGAQGQDFLSLSLVFGTVPDDPCMTVRRLPCRARGEITSCKSQ